MRLEKCSKCNKFGYHERKKDHCQGCENIPKVLINKIHDKARIPTKSDNLDACFDLYACLDESVVIEPSSRVLIPLGLKCFLPEGFEAQIRPRSGLAIKNGVTVLNTPGTIDEGYEGEWKVILVNLGDEPFCVNSSDRIAQVSFKKVEPVVLEFSENFGKKETKRGEGGFGHSGI